uniref:COMMD1 N-terminal domain-containing protein n=1 Tax=Nothoprocta perdicaria TaxID=30464 RepID=A0A8C7A0C7_NOTPE
MAAAAEAAEGGRPLGALLGAIAQAAYHGQPLAEEPLRGQLYPEAAPEEFRALRAKMGGLNLKKKKKSLISCRLKFTLLFLHISGGDLYPSISPYPRCYL